jgi:hypothetical protein
MLTRLSCARVCRKTEDVMYDIDFQSYWVFTAKMVKTSNYPSHFMLSKTEFQQQPSTTGDYNSQTVDPMRMG